jgi:hemolysin activation/secretion protein
MSCIKRLATALPVSVIIFFFLVSITGAQPEGLGDPPPAPEPKAAPLIELIQRPPLEVPEEDIRFQVNRILLSGVTVFAPDELAPLLAEYEGREQGLSDLYELAGRIAGFYNRRGYFLAQALVPEQDIADGTVELYVLEGRAGKVEITGNQHYRSEFIHRYFAPLYRPASLRKPRQGLEQGAIRYQDLERAMLLLNDHLNL